jgi:hypothetical protein
LPKNLAKILPYFSQTTASFAKKLIITLAFEKNANFSPKIGKNCEKIVIIISTPDKKKKEPRSGFGPWLPGEASPDD